MPKIHCAFFNADNEYGVIFCDNLVSGVPSCVLAEFYRDVLHALSVDTLKEYNEWYTNFGVCSHFVVGELPSKLAFGVCCNTCTYKLVGFYHCSSECFIGIHVKSRS